MKMPAEKLKPEILESLKSFDKSPLKIWAARLFGTLGYRSDRTLDLSPNTPKNFLQTFDAHGRFRPNKGFLHKWISADILFQVTDKEINALSGDQLRITFESDRKIEDKIIQSYLFMAVELKKDHYTRTDLANITREINRLFPMPVLILFKNGETLTFSIINRRLHKKDASKDVLEKVTLIKDIRYGTPHRAHIEILYDLAFSVLFERHQISDFVSLQRAWQKTLDTNELNKRFYREMAYWYFWAVKNVTFPRDAGEDEEVRNAASVIRLITRLIFVWFIKEKGLVPDDLFNRDKLDNILNFSDPKKSAYYKAILQNLFFATLNQEMNTPEKPDNRKFRSKSKNAGGRDQHYMIHNVYRYESYFKNLDEALKLFSTIPFLNGGLFECLDKPDKPDDVDFMKILRIDGFSDRKDNELILPDFLFFCEKQPVDLNKCFGTKNKRYEVRGIIDIFNSYKFTITENTPIEEEIALDPELLGKVFENLLASYNPETETTARKLTGSFYTPREIVNYMVDEVLIAYLGNALVRNFETGVELSPRTPPSQGKMFGKPDPVQTKLIPTQRKIPVKIRKEIQEKLKHLFEYNEGDHQFNDHEVEILIEAVDNVKILDPACGSGAFPMGILHRLVYLLGRLDSGNKIWKAKQLAKAVEIPDSTIRERVIADIEKAFEENELDYGRKLYLIENCIYGVDIQPIAVQIARLRFFISLVVDQKINNTQENRGILPLPNLETNFVAANSLLGIEVPEQRTIRNLEIAQKEKELAEVRRRHFTARTPKTKAKYRALDKQLRNEISKLLKEWGYPHETTEKLAYYDPYDQNASIDYFDPEWMFGVADGFDITIGNPPYVRADSGEQHLAMRKTIEGSKLYETLWEKWDLYIPFIERGYKLLKPDGFSTMIVSDAFCHSKYAQKSQEWFLKNSRVLRLDFFSKIKIFDAGVHNITYLFQKADGIDNKPERQVHDPEFGAVKVLKTSEQNKLNYRAFFPEDTISQQPHNSNVLLSSICWISYGLTPSSDEHAAKGEFTTSDLVSETRDQLHCKAFVEGKHLECWIPLSNLWIEWGSDRAPQKFRRPTFPEMYDVPEKVLAQRSPGPDPKACYDNRNLIFTPSSIGFIPWHSLSGVRNRSLKKFSRYRDERPPRPDLPKREDLEKISHRFAVKFLLAAMNSTVACNFLRANRRSNIHLYPNDWKQLPIPEATPQQQAPVVKCVDEILTALRADPAADIRSTEAEIDARVAHLYKITEEEYSLILSETDTPGHLRIAALNSYRDMA